MSDPNAFALAEEKDDLHGAVFRNSLAIILSRFITAAASLATVPVIIRSIGMEGFGVWEATLALCTVVQLMIQAPITGTIWWRLAVAAGKNDNDEMTRLLRCAVTLTLGILTASMPLAWLGRAGLVRFLEVPPSMVAAAERIIPLCLAMVLLGGINDTLAGVLSTFQKSGLATMIVSASTIIQQLTVMVLVWSGFGLWGIIGGYLFGYSLSWFGLYLTAKHFCKSLSMVPVAHIGSDIHHFWTYGKSLWIGYLSSVLRDSANKLIITRLSSPVWVGIYSLATRLTSLLMEWLTFFSRPLYGAAGALHSSARHKELDILYRDNTLLVATGVTYLGMIIYGLQELILIAWVGHPVPELQMILVFSILGSGMAIILSGPGTTLCRATGRADVEAKYLIYSLILNLVFLSFLVPWFGAIGCVIASTSAWGIAAIVFNFTLKKHFGFLSSVQPRVFAIMSTGLVGCLCLRYFTVPSHLNISKLEAIASLCFTATVTGIMFLAVLFAFRLLDRHLIRLVCNSFRSFYTLSRSENL